MYFFVSNNGVEWIFSFNFFRIFINLFLSSINSKILFSYSFLLVVISSSREIDFNKLVATRAENCFPILFTTGPFDQRASLQVV